MRHGRTFKLNPNGCLPTNVLVNAFRQLYGTALRHLPPAAGRARSSERTAAMSTTWCSIPSPAAGQLTVPASPAEAAILGYRAEPKVPRKWPPRQPARRSKNLCVEWPGPEKTTSDKNAGADQRVSSGRKSPRNVSFVLGAWRRNLLPGSHFRPIAGDCTTPSKIIRIR